MKISLSVFLALACVLPLRAESWSLHMPETGLLPSYAKASFMSRMHQRHGDSHLALQEYELNLPITDPRRSHYGDWWLNVQGNLTLSLVDMGASFGLRKDELYEFSLPITLIHPLSQNEKFFFTLMPRYAGDAVHFGRGFDLSFVADYTIRRSETLSWSIGLAGSPRFADYIVVPWVSAMWQATPDWLIRFKGYSLAALYSMSKRLSIGPSLSGSGGTWMVDSAAGQRILRVRSLVASLLAEYDFSAVGQRKRIAFVSIGSTLVTRAELCRRNTGHDSEASAHYKPGFFLSLGADFRF